jgi:hypothetical protein
MDQFRSYWRMSLGDVFSAIFFYTCVRSIPIVKKDSELRMTGRVRCVGQ